MGSGIAAHLANIGFQVTLLDATPNSIKSAYDKARGARPPHFYRDSTADSIRLGSIEENLDWVTEADWVCEAIVEKLEAKRDLFSKIEPLIRPDALVSTNTSGLQIELLCEGRNQAWQNRFLGTHFFNPPRYLKLLELIPTTHTDPELLCDAVGFFETHCARRVVIAKDTPGFIANRYGMWSMIFAVQVAEKLGLTVEEVDAITGPFLGRPKSASFRLNDVVGLDIMADIAKNLVDRCPHDRSAQSLSPLPTSLQVLLERGWIGGKAGQGYYRKEGKEFLSFDLLTHAYRQRKEEELDSIKALGRLPLGTRLQQALDLRDPVGEYLREYLVPALQYANSLKSEISHSVRDFDRVMQWGFGWEAGPFELIDLIGGERLGIADAPFYRGCEVKAFSGEFFTPNPEPAFRTIQEAQLLSHHDGFNIRDLGDGVKAVSLTTKMGVISPTVVTGLTQFLESGEAERIVFISEAKVFSAGFDLRFFIEAAQEGRTVEIDRAIDAFQKLGLLFGQIPSVAAVWGYCLGGGFEMAASCSEIVASPETQIGLPEAKVGLIPGGGGTPLMRLRCQAGGAKALVDGVKTLAQGIVSANADDARQYGYLRPQDTTEYHPDRLLTTALSRVHQVTAASLPTWQPVSGPFLGMAGAALQELKAKGDFTDYDELIGDKIKNVFGKSIEFPDALQREREAFLALVTEGRTLARMRYMVENGRPLRN
jgi:3-hydroxyacyl-CoA dehydrogenase